MYYDVFEKLCKMRGVTPAEVSRNTGVATATLTNWKKGNYTPKMDKLQKIADYFGVGIECFTTRKGEALKMHYEDRRIKAIVLAEDIAPGLSYLIKAYTTFDIDDRNEIVEIAKIKMKKYKEKEAHSERESIG